MEEVVILSAKRTPIGKLGGDLAGASAVDLGVAAAQAQLRLHELTQRYSIRRSLVMSCRLVLGRMLPDKSD